MEKFMGIYSEDMKKGRFTVKAEGGARGLGIDP